MIYRRDILHSGYEDAFLRDINAIIISRETHPSHTCVCVPYDLRLSDSQNTCMNIAGNHVFRGRDKHANNKCHVLVVRQIAMTKHNGETTVNTNDINIVISLLPQSLLSANAYTACLFTRPR